MPETTKTYKEKLIEFNGLYKKYSASDIMDKLKINSNEFNKMLSEVIKGNREFANKEVVTCFKKSQYSANEDDYGISDKRKVMITKKGLFSFENSPITEPYPSFMKMASDEYKQMCKQNNIRI